MEHSKLTPEAQRAVDLYAVRLHDLLIKAAQSQRLDPETFLWNSRRLMEAICLMLLAVDENSILSTDGKGKDTSLDGLIQNLSNKHILSRQRDTAWKLVAQQCNLGVHVRQAEPVDYAEAVADVVHGLPRALEWLIERSPAAKHLPDTTPIRRALNEVRLGGRFDPELPVGLDEQDAPTVEEDITEESVDDTAPPPAARSTPWPPRPARSMRAPSDEAMPEQSAPRSRGALGFGILLLGSLAAAGALLVVGASFWLAEPTSPEPTGSAVSAVAPAVTTTRAPEPSKDANAAPATRSAAPLEPRREAPTRSCPDGMALIEAMEIHIGQPLPERKGWPAPHPKEISPKTVPAFCIDRVSRTRAQFAEWGGSRGAQKTDCLWSKNGADDAAVVCLRRDAAAAYCASQPGHLSLPSVLQWEVIARLEDEKVSKSNLDLGPVREWVEDLSPPEVFNRRSARCSKPECQYGIFRETMKSANKPDPDGNVLFGWYPQEPQQGWSNLGFRCASSPLTTP